MFSNDINKSNELSENEKVKAVEDLADKIMKTHYYYYNKFWEQVTMD